MHKKFWDVERGVTYIPWGKVKVEELDTYREGGMLDEETLNPGKVSVSRSYFFFFFAFCLADSVANFPTLRVLFFFFFVAEWNRSNDLSRLALGNGALESIAVDGTVTAHMQVMMMQFLTHYGLQCCVIEFIYAFVFILCAHKKGNKLFFTQVVELI